MIDVACSSCGKQLSVQDQLAGRPVTCPHCGQIAPVPVAVPAFSDRPNSPELPPSDLTTVPRPGQANPPTAEDLRAGSAPPEDTASLQANPSPGGTGEERYDFLALPQSPDEMGRLGSYRILKVLGAGGMGVVFLAEDIQLRRRVALKAMKPCLTPGASANQRFLREAQALAAIRHDHIITIYHVGEDRGVPFLAMELLEGETLQDRLRRDSRLPLADILRIGREIALGLAAAHKRGLIHRDIKPANIWLEAETGRVKILDFGLARVADDDPHLTQTGQIVGTPSYMAPEQAQGEKSDVRCDLFSLGCVLYRMCTGQLPFQGSNSMSVLRALAVETPRPPRAVQPDIPEALSSLVEQLLVKDPAERLASARTVVELIETLERDPEAGSLSVAERDTSPKRQPGNLPPSVALRACVQPEGARPALALPEEVARRPLAASPTTLPVRSGKRRILVGLAAALLLMVGISLGAGVVLRITTAQGELVIEAEDREVQVRVRQGEAIIIDPTTQRTFTLKPGEYDIEVVEGKDGLKLSTDNITIRRGERVLVKVHQEPRKTIQPREPVQAEEADLHKLLAREADPKEDRERLRNDILALGRRHPGTWPGMKGAELLRRLPSPLDRLQASQIPPYEQAVAGNGDPEKAPTGLVAILGDSRLKHWRDADGVALSPDGKVVASASPDGTLKLWDVATGNVLRSLTVRRCYFYCVAFSPDGLRLAAGGGAVVGLWEAATGKALAEWSDLKGMVRSIAFSPDGSLLAAGEHSGQIVLCEAASAGKALHLLKGHRQLVWSVAFSPDSRMLASGSADGMVRLWDVAQGMEIRTVTDAYKDRGVSSAVFLPNSQRLATQGGDQVDVWETATWQRLKTFPAAAPAWSHPLVCSGDGKILASGGPAEVKLWEVNGWKELPGPTQSSLAIGWLKSIALNADGFLMVGGFYSGEVRLWETLTQREQHHASGHHGCVQAVAFSPDGRVLASGGVDHQVKLWETATGKELGTLSGTPHPVVALAFAPDGQLLAFASGPQARLVETATAKELGTISVPRGPITALAYHPQGTMLALGSKDATIALWEPAKGKLLRLLKGHKEEITSVAFSPDGRGLVSGSKDQTLKYWDLETGTELRTVAVKGDQIWGNRVLVAFSPDGGTLACGNGDGTVQLWDAATGKELHSLKEHLDAISGLAFRPDGQQLATAGQDGSVRVWNPATGNQEHVFQLGPVYGNVFGVAFSPDSRYLATANGNGTVYILRLAPALGHESSPAPNGGAFSPVR